MEAQVRVDELILLTIKRMGINGEGIGYYKRQAIFVSNAIVGEVVEVKITEVRDGYAYGEITKFKKVSPNRIEPRCPYYGKCGGCQLQHIDYLEQLKQKKALVEEAFEKCRKARLHILDDIMAPVIDAPRAELSKYAPKMKSMKIDPDKIKDVIGKGGKVIQKICAECEVQIDIEDDGSVFISGLDANNLNKAYHIIKTIVDDPEPGSIYKGVVTRLMNFGAFVEIAPGKEGLVHISKLDEKRVAKVEDVVNVGDEILVMVTEIDDQNRINLSRKDAIAKINAKKEENK